MKSILLFLLFLLFLSAFFLVVSVDPGFILLTIFIMGGSRSAECLVQWAQGSGDHHRAVMLQCKLFLFRIFTDILIQIILFLGVFVTLYCVDLIRETDSWMIWIKQHGITLLLVALGVYCITAEGIRLYFRTITKSRTKDEASSTTIDAPFCVYCRSHPSRISKTKHNIQVGIHLYLILIFYPFVFIAPKLRSFALILGMIGLMIIAFLLYSLVRESLTVDLLIELDSDGIHDRNPTRNIGFIPWSKISRLQYVKNRTCIMLHLNEDGSDPQGTTQSAMLQLDRAYISQEIIVEKMMQFHKNAAQTTM